MSLWSNVSPRSPPNSIDVLDNSYQTPNLHYGGSSGSRDPSLGEVQVPHTHVDRIRITGYGSHEPVAEQPYSVIEDVKVSTVMLAKAVHFVATDVTDTVGAIRKQGLGQTLQDAVGDATDLVAAGVGGASQWLWNYASGKKGMDVSEISVPPHLSSSVLATRTGGCSVVFDETAFLPQSPPDIFRGLSLKNHSPTPEGHIITAACKGSLPPTKDFLDEVCEKCHSLNPEKIAAQLCDHIRQEPTIRILYVLEGLWDRGFDLPVLYISEDEDVVKLLSSVVHPRAHAILQKLGLQDPGAQQDLLDLSPRPYTSGPMDLLEDQPDLLSESQAQPDLNLLDDAQSRSPQIDLLDDAQIDLASSPDLLGGLNGRDATDLLGDATDILGDATDLLGDATDLLGDPSSPDPEAVFNPMMCREVKAFAELPFPES